MNITPEQIKNYQELSKNIIERQKTNERYLTDSIEIIKNIEKNKLNQLLDFAPKIPKIPKIYDALNAYASTYEALGLSASSHDKIEKLKTEIKEKEIHNNSLISEAKKLNQENQDISTQLEEIQKNHSLILKKMNLLRLTSSIHPKAADVILEDNNELLKMFHSENETLNAILSIDIRRSTDLMLNANSSDDFASFITDLCEGLKNIVITNLGVFDKFTGDGILAYFPLFYSGEDAVYRCCITSQLCHAYFSAHYKNNRSKFKICLKTGLGIGIDYGYAKLVRINEEPTIVGAPVVYASRFSNAPSGHTYLNQSAYQALKDKDIILSEIDIEIKNQGIVTVYDLTELGISDVKEPDWLISSKNEP